MNPRIEEYLNALRKNLGHMARDERDAVLAEIQDHLQAESDRLQAGDSSLSDDVAAARAISAFGPAEEIGVAYGGGSGNVRVINHETGERLLEGIQVAGRVAGKVAVAGGRGLRGVLKYVGIAALVIIAVAGLIAAAGVLTAGTLATAYKDEIASSVPRPLYGYHQSWYSTEDAETSTTTESFDIRDGVKEIWIDMDISADGGCARIVLTDPSGDVRYDSDQVCGDDYASRQFSFAEKGQWSIQYTYIGYTGSVSVDAQYFEEASSG